MEEGCGMESRWHEAGYLRGTARLLEGYKVVVHWMVRDFTPVGWLLIACMFVMIGVDGARRTVNAVEIDQAPAQKTYAFVKGRWFDGRQFVEDTFYAVAGRLTRKQPPVIDDTVDLGGGFVVPPFGEAHNHNVEGPWNIGRVIEGYLHDGVFYVKNPNSIRQFTEQIAHRLNKPDSIDVVFANAGLTSSGGHPVPLYEHLLRESRYRTIVGEVPPGWFNDRGYVLIDRKVDVETKWTHIMEGKPDFLKVFLAHSEEVVAAQPNVPLPERRGLEPSLLPDIVARAHRAGLRVTAHVETAADFRLAVSAGVDEIAHLPGWFVAAPAHLSRMLLSREDARLAAQAGMTVVTTTVAMKPSGVGHGHQLNGSSHHQAQQAHASPFSMAPSLWLQAQKVMKRNLALLHRHGVKVVIGSDHAETSLEEVLHLHELDIFDNLTLLKLWCEATPQSIFPGRRIGRLDEGYEASFLVLTENPLDRFEAVTTIALRVKQGQRLTSGK